MLRGFDEESQYLSRYAIGTVEYHYLIGLNSYFYALLDGGGGRITARKGILITHISVPGWASLLKPRQEFLNLAWAIGKRSDTQLNLRQSKIHFGFVNYF
ncbi:MAG: hypothetical protein WDO19_11255 [Bacteroidota bacterium]